jgi:hypothetical protein
MSSANGENDQEGNTMETEFTPWLSLAGGILIGLSAILLMACSTAVSQA